MAVHVDALRKLLDTTVGQEVELPVEALGFGEDAVRALFPDEVLRFVLQDGDPQALRAAGTATVAVAAQPAALRLAISPDGVSARAFTLDLGIDGPGVPAHLLAGGLGLDVPPLPGALVEQVTVTADPNGGMLTAEGPGMRVRILTGAARAFLAEAADGWQVIGTDHQLTRERLLSLTRRSDVPRPGPYLGELPVGTWLLLPGTGRRPVPLRPARPAVDVDGSRLDGLGRALPTRKAREPRRFERPVRAIATRTGFAVLAGADGERGNGRWELEISDDEAVINVAYDYAPLQVTGGLGKLPAEAPYRSIVGGVLMFSFGGGDPADGAKAGRGVYGTGVGAYVVPDATGAKPSFFGYAGLGADPGFGIPAIRLNGVAAGLGWNSRIRLPEVSEIGDFPLLKALDDPGSIGAENENPIEILRRIATGPDAWITPAQDELWVAAGLKFTVAELIEGRAMAVVQTGADLTIALLGTAAAALPKSGSRKYAQIEAALRAVLKPRQGELQFDAELTPNSFLLDPNCRLRGGVAFRSWFGPSPHAGDFVYTVGGYHPNFTAPDRYPRVPRLGFDWDLTGSVTISGSAYLAITPAAAMAGGALDVRFHSGVIRAWCTAKVDALIQWKPFYVDVGLQVRIGVSATVKILFVKVSITVEVGVALGIWGPPTGGQAKIKLWFISFTINFGKGREGSDNALDWAGFREMLPPPPTTVRVTPGVGLLVDHHPGGARGAEAGWEVSANGFTLSTDSAVPLKQIFLGTSTTAAETGPALNIRPMRERNLVSTQRITLTHDGDAVDPATWSRSRCLAAVPEELWGTSAQGTLPDGDKQVLKDQLTGVSLSSPAARHGTSTGYIDEKALAFDPIYPDGRQPLDPDAGPEGTVPQRPGGVIATIADTVAAGPQTTARARLAGQLTALGLELGPLDSDLSGYARAARTAFTAEPMLVAAS
ncbi:DUF6603 domain-containing protein [Kitasatospora aureofaciens]|uniref:DUF6603 domain-containing protein n=1 Tax=Kitasatospora aureofaciens TaxID=1894 RepID=UPI00068DC091|nr:DUF6603 domain-containing protein [Kitasatospora aureofaciens]